MKKKKWVVLLVLAVFAIGINRVSAADDGTLKGVVLDPLGAGVPGAMDSGIFFYQEQFDQAGIVRNYTKWQYELTRPETSSSTTPAGWPSLARSRAIRVESVARRGRCEWRFSPLRTFLQRACASASRPSVNAMS